MSKFYHSAWVWIVFLNIGISLVRYTPMLENAGVSQADIMVMERYTERYIRTIRHQLGSFARTQPLTFPSTSEPYIITANSEQADAYNNAAHAIQR